MILRSAVLAVFAALVLAGLLGQDALPRMDEPASVYASRLIARGGQLAEDFYIQALFLFPGATEASVTVTRNDPGTSLKMTSGGQGAEEALQKSDVLKQDLAKNEIEIDAQQKVSAKRYAEAKREQESQNQNSDSILLPLEQPDEIRASMPPVDRNGPEMRCGHAIPPESRTTTRNVELHTRSIFQGKHGDQYAWKYIVKFTNHGEDTVQMLTRHWVFVDALGKLESEVKGPGARGVTPVLPPGGEWVYESGSSLPSPYGSMHGSFQFEVLKSTDKRSPRSFSARVGRLALSQDKKKQNVPCIEEAKEGLLPLTSVLSIERVILGGRADYAKKKNGKYYYNYDVQINNARDTDVEVIGHLWEVVDSDGQRTTIAEGKGVGGVYSSKTRKLAAGDAFRTQGQLFSSTPSANAQGTYRVLIRGEDGEEHEVETRTDYMGLSAKRDVTHVPNFVADPNFR